MASLDSKIRPSGYLIRTKDLGLDTSFQTNTKKKKEANDILVEFNGNVAKVKNKRLQYDDAWTTDEKVHLLRFGEAPKDSVKLAWSVSEAVDLFLKAHESLAFNTINGYRHKLECCKAFFKKTPINRITRQRVQDFINDQKDQKVKSSKDGQKISIAELKKRVNHLKMLLNWCHGQQAMDADPLPMFKKGLRFPNRDQPLAYLWENDKDTWDSLDDRNAKLKQYGIAPSKAAYSQVFLEGPEIQRLVQLLERKLYESDSLRKRRLFVAVLFAVYTAARRSEIVKVGRRDVDLVNRTVRIRIRKGRSEGKEFIFHTIPLADDFVPFLRQHLTELPSERELLFTANDNHVSGEGFDEKKERLAGRHLSYELETALKGTEFEFTSGWHLHRHSLNSLLASKGVGPEEIRLLVGHKTEKVSITYRHAAMGSKRETIKNVSFGGTKGVQNDGSKVASEAASL